MYIFRNLILTLSLLTLLHSTDESNNTKSTGFFNFDKRLFVSEEDGKFDLSAFLLTKYGYLPIPVVVTEPAIGYGGGLNVVFLHDSLASSAQRKSPPSISGAVGVGTENGTKVAAAYHVGFWEEDSIRTVSAIGGVDINIDFYLRNLGVDMNFEGYAAYQELLFRIGESDFFLGGNYLYVDIESKRNEGDLPILDPFFEHEFKMGALSAVAQYDTRDSIFTPSDGLFVKATLRRFDESFGGDENFWRYGAKVFYFQPLFEDVTLGLRFEGEAVYEYGNDRVPYVAYPSIVMRGIDAMRYQGEKMMLGEVQFRWEFIERWNMVFFGGSGKVYGNENRFEPGTGVVKENVSFLDAPAHAAGGVGFRYELARKFGLWAGVDFATNEEKDFSFYITVGSAWGAY